MTKAEWDAVMQRWMHRTDVAADLPEIYAFASTQVHNRWMGAFPYDNETDALAALRGPYTHAGLLYLHELAQDDMGAQREMGFLDSATQDAQMAWSINNSDAQATPWYVTEPEAV